jgi:hypothetical protein
VVFIFWDIKSVFYAVWRPFDFMMGYTDPRKPSDDRLHGARRGAARRGSPRGEAPPRLPLLADTPPPPPGPRPAEWFFRSSLDRYICESPGLRLSCARTAPRIAPGLSCLGADRPAAAS